MMAALGLPRLLDRVSDRRVMIPAAALGAVLLAFAAVAGSRGATLWAALLVTWTLLELGYSAVVTPAGRLLRSSAQAAGRPCSRFRTAAGS